MQGVLRRGEEIRSQEAPDVILRSGWAVLEGRIVEDSVRVTPDVDDVSWEITIGDTPLSEGDDELTVTLTPPEPGRARTGVTVAFDVTAVAPNIALVATTPVTAPAIWVTT